MVCRSATSFAAGGANGDDIDRAHPCRFPLRLGVALAVNAVLPYGAANTLSIALASGSVVAMSQCLILAARPSLLEPLFGGLDRMYRVHKWLGISAMALMIGHQLVEPHFKRWTPETSIGELAGEAGEFALYGFIGLILVSWFKRLPYLNLEIPYQLWRLSHRLTGVLFAIVAFHQLFTDKPIAAGTPLSLYLNAFCIAGLCAYAYTELLAPRLRRREFEVSDIVRRGNVVDVLLAPRSTLLDWKPGQFAFVSSPDAGMSEPHPFTIASAPRDTGEIRFAIKSLGDWTQRLPTTLRQGMRVVVEGPYGRFDFRKGRKQQIWLAGGIGITPFLAWAESLTSTEPFTIHLVYCVTTPDEVIGLDVLEKAKARNARFSFDVVASSSDGRLTAHRLQGGSPFLIKDADMFYCGPVALRAAMERDLAAMGQSPRSVYTELFELR